MAQLRIRLGCILHSLEVQGSTNDVTFYIIGALDGPDLSATELTSALVTGIAASELSSWVLRGTFGCRGVAIACEDFPAVLDPRDNEEFALSTVAEFTK